jgi:hypothetical protein
MLIGLALRGRACLSAIEYGTVKVNYLVPLHELTGQKSSEKLGLPDNRENRRRAVGRVGCTKTGKAFSITLT